MTKLIITSLLAIALGFGAIATTSAGPLGEPWTTVTQEGQ